MGTSIAYSLLLMFFLFNSYSCTNVELQEEKGGGGEDEKVFIGPLAKPMEEVGFEGGVVRVWWRDECVGANVEKQRPCMMVEVSETILEEDGLMLPQYSDSNAISYVLQGSGKVGIVNPGSDRMLIRRVERGDVIVIPKGVVFWWYNDGFGRHRIFSASDTARAISPGIYQQFALVGARADRFGGILHGFPNETLATAWGVDEGTISLLKSSQNGTAIIKSPSRIIFPELRILRMGPKFFSNGEEDNDILSEFRYNLDREYPDFYVERGGWMKLVNQDDLHAIKQVKMSVMKTVLEKNATEGPSFFTDAHQMIYVIDGHGKVEVATSGENNNESFVSFDVQEGSVFIIPKFYPSIKLASDEGVSFVSLLTSPRPSSQTLVGSDSFFQRIPNEVLIESFCITEDALSKLMQARHRHGSIFPPSPTS